MSELGSICRERGVVYHSDITQAAGKIAWSLADVDLASFSAHKLYGPKGIGGLFIRRGVRIERLVIGGGQARNVRGGTVNVPGVAGMAAAFRIRADEMREEGRRLTALRNELWDRLAGEIAGVSVNGPRELRLPGNLNVSFDGIEADSLIVAMRRFALSSGAPSALTAIGLSEAAARGSIRIGHGRSNTAAHVEMLIDDCKRLVAKLREKTSAV